MYGVLPMCVRVYHVHVYCPRRSEEGIGSPGTGITDRCTLPSGCWELKLGSLGEQTVSQLCLPCTFTYIKVDSGYSLSRLRASVCRQGDCKPEVWSIWAIPCTPPIQHSDGVWWFSFSITRLVVSPRKRGVLARVQPSWVQAMHAVWCGDAWV